MAQMVPHAIPEDIRRDPYRSSEIRIYERLSEQLPDDFVCYYSRPWLGLRPDGGEIDGEADFVIAHRDLGLLIIEVKGGRISRRSKDDQWLTTDRHGITHRIKDPVAQARKSKYQLLEKFNEAIGKRFKRINARHGVILPDNSRPEAALGADAPLELFAFGNDLDSLHDWVADRLSTTGDTPSGEGLGADGMKVLHHILAANFELRPHLAGLLSDDSKQIERLTREQFLVLESLEDNPQMGISGGAGTGKTLLALEKACRSAEQGKRTLFVCFNTALGQYLKALGKGQDNLEVGSFHSICGMLASKAGISVNSSKNIYDSALADALIEVMDQLPKLKYDAIIIDEGQDFDDNWLAALRLSLTDMEQGLFYVFYDDNQQIYNKESAFLPELPSSQFRLNKNLRNTRQIHKTLGQWYKGKQIHAVGPKGVPVNWVPCGRDMLRSQVTKIVRELVQSKQLPIDDIAILTSCPREKSSLCNADRLAGFDLKEATDSRKGKLLCDTIRRFKGLEKKCVILIDIDHLLEEELIYVALSRPSLLLYVLGSKTDLQRLNKAG